MVIGIEVVVNGAPCAVIDISRSGVRLLRPAGFNADKAVLIDFTLARCGRLKGRSLCVEGLLVRATTIDMTYRYATDTNRRCRDGKRCCAPTILSHRRR